MSPTNPVGVPGPCEVYINLATCRGPAAAAGIALKADAAIAAAIARTSTTRDRRRSTKPGLAEPAEYGVLDNCRIRVVTSLPNRMLSTESIRLTHQRADRARVELVARRL